MDKKRSCIEEDNGRIVPTLYETITSCRWTLAYIGCICFTLLYALRINMGIAIVCMVKPSNVSQAINNNHGGCAGNLSASASDDVEGTIEWDKTMQGAILSSFFYGYIVTQIPAGYLSGRFGGKRVMFIGMIIYGIATVVLPFAARYKDAQTAAYLVIALRVIMGLASGVSFPAMHSLWGRWAPPYERSKLMVLCYSGTMVGNVLMLGVGGFFCEWTSFDGGWPSMFYIGGGLDVVFCIWWLFVVYDSPSEHPRITEKERLYIQQCMESKQDKHNESVPWMAIFKSPAMWAILVAHSCNNFGNYTLITKLPAFMKEVLKFDIKSNGLYSALPYITMFVVANTISNIVDRLRERGTLSTAAARKLAMMMAFVIPAIFLIATGHIPCGMEILGVVFLTLAVGFTGFNRSGYNTNHVDIAPKYAGELFGITNTAATIPGMVAPLAVNAMTPNGTPQEWQQVFYVWASIFTFGAIFFAIFARGEVQDWAKESDDQSDGGKDEYVQEEKLDTRF